MIFAVIRNRGGSWDFSKPMERQSAWRQHAEFMDRLHEEGRCLLAGPIGGERKVLLIIQAESVEETEKLLAEDVWTKMGLLETVSIEPWTLRIGELG